MPKKGRAAQDSAVTLTEVVEYLTRGDNYYGVETAFIIEGDPASPTSNRIRIWSQPRSKAPYNPYLHFYSFERVFSGSDLHSGLLLRAIRDHFATLGNYPAHWGDECDARDELRVKERASERLAQLSRLLQDQ